MYSAKIKPKMPLNALNASAAGENRALNAVLIRAIDKVSARSPRTENIIGVNAL